MFTDPRKIILQSGITGGMHVGDFGVGSGAYTSALSQIVRDPGRVYAVDIQKDLLIRLRNTLSDTQEKGARVDVLHGNLEKVGGSKIRSERLDFVIASNIFFQAEDKRMLFSEIYRTLQPKGRLLLVDWTESFGGFGPQRGSLISFDDARVLAAENGFSYKRDIPAGEYHYGIIFEKVS